VGGGGQTCKVATRRGRVDTNVLVYARDRSDALVVAAALAADCDYLLSEDLQDGQVVDGLTVISPFTHEPGAIPGS